MDETSSKAKGIGQTSSACVVSSPDPLPARKKSASRASGHETTACAGYMYM